jgi:hypothetical protein
MQSTYTLCVCLSVYYPKNIWMLEPVFIKLGTYVSEPTSVVHFMNCSYQSACFYVQSLLSLLGNGSVNILLMWRIQTQ